MVTMTHRDLNPANDSPAPSHRELVRRANQHDDRAEQAELDRFEYDKDEGIGRYRRAR